MNEHLLGTDSREYLQLSVVEPQILTEEEAQEAARAAIKAERERQKAETLRRAQHMLVCDESVLDRAAELTLCEHDFFYFLENWVWIEEPRTDIKRIPFLPYGYQRSAAEKIISLAASTVDSVEKHDVLVEKTRDMGWSWLMCALAVWYWRFHDKNILFGSRKAELVDKLGDMKTLLEKCRYIIRNLPEWMYEPGFRPDKHMGEMLIRKPDGYTGSGTIAGESANPDFGRGDRKWMIILDEFASWAFDVASAQACGDATSLRVFISTPKGPNNKFAAMRMGEDNIKPAIITSHWVQHPLKAAGLTKTHEGLPTSPWYQKECARKSVDEIAAEIDICYATSTKGRVFDDYIPEWHTRKLVVDPSVPVIRVWDPGLTFYVLFLQIDKYSRVLCLKEILDTNSHIRDIADAVCLISDKYFRDCTFVDYGDPAGARRMQSSAEASEFQVLREEYSISVDTSFMDGMPMQVRTRNKIQAIHNKLRQQIVATKTQALLIDPVGCETLHRAMIQDYRYKVDPYTKKVSEIPESEHPWEDAVDCLAYGILAEIGVGTQGAVPITRKTVEIERSSAKWNVWGKRKRVNEI